MDAAARPDLLGTFGAVTSTHWLASGVGMAVLEKGGNAFDAAVAMGFMLQVVEPHQNGLGGEVPIIVKAAGQDEPVVICGQGCAPALATSARLRELGLDMVPGTGLIPAVVPGAFGAWMALLRDYGTLSLRDVLSYSIGYAEDGFPLFPRILSTILPARRRFLDDWPSSGEVWLPGGRPPRANERFRTPGLAGTYKRLLAEAEAAGGNREKQIEAALRAFYEGFVAEAIDAFYSTAELADATGRRLPGLLRGSDMAGWRAKVERTLSLEYRGVRVHKAGPWSQGPADLQELALLKGFDLEGLDPQGPDFIHILIECAKLALADRDIYYGDPDFADVPLETLLSEAYNAERRKQVGEDANPMIAPGHLAGHAERLASLLGQAGRDHPPAIDCGEPVYQELPREYGDTVHLDATDRFGNTVSATPSGGWLQGSPVVPGLGFCVTTRGQMFWLDEGLPSSLTPGARPRTTLSPTLVQRDEHSWLALGAPGGDQQGQWPLFALLRHLHCGLSLQQAIEAPNFHAVHFPQSFYPRETITNTLSIEERVPEETIADLSRRGHIVVREKPWSLGRVCMVQNDDNLIRAAASPRQIQAYALCR
jgi:gamma-glutamyltranspeptidase/glutathione hydrolase